MHFSKELLQEFEQGNRTNFNSLLKQQIQYLLAAMSHPQHLLLDSSIRDWVVIPMLIMLLLVGMGRHYVQTVIKSVPTFTEKDLAEQSYKNTCTKSSCLRIHGNYICEAAFNMRKAHMIRKKTGA